MTNKVTEQFLEEKFNKAAMRLNGSWSTGQFKIQIENFCDKVETLWELTDEKHKPELAAAFGRVMSNTVRDTATQNNTPALAEATESVMVMGKTAAYMAGYLPVSVAKDARFIYYRLQDLAKDPSNGHVAGQIRLSAYALEKLSDELLTICQSPRRHSSNFLRLQTY